MSKITDILHQACAVAKIGWWEVDIAARIPLWSDITKQILEVPEQYTPTMTGAIHFYKEGEHRNKIVAAVNQAIEKGIPYEMDLVVITANNTEKWIKTIGFTEFENGKCTRLYGTFQDIHETKSQELKLRQSEEAFRKSFEYAAIGKAVVSIEGRWIRINRSLCQLLGYTEQELLLLTFRDITHPEDLDADRGLMQETLSGLRENYHFEKRYLHKEGYIVHALLSLSLVKDSDGNPDYFIYQITNITEQKKAEKELANALITLKGVLEASTHVAIITTDKEGLITSFNKGAENLLGYSGLELIHLETPMLFHDVAEVNGGATGQHSGAALELNGFTDFAAKAQVDNHYANEWLYRKKNGETFPVQLVLTAIKDSTGATSGYLEIATDITNIKNAQNELTSLLDVMRDQNGRLKNFAHIVSHNLRSHSSNLSMLIDLVSHEQQQDMKDEMFVMLEFAAAKLTETINHLNEVVIVNNVTAEALKLINLQQSIYNAVALVAALLKNAHAVLDVQVAENITVAVVPAYLDSIFNNLLTNAIKYRSPDRQLVIKITAEKQRNGILLTVEDNGQGIDLKKNGHKIFGMYKTFHNNPDARGIGLFITKNQVESMGGKIDVASEVGHGTTFKVLLNEKI